LDCPFLGRCGYNAVVSRATHGVWGGEVLPGDYMDELLPIYERLLAQFEERLEAELGNTPAPPMPDLTAVRRRRRAA
jgi:WhiB family redox-sensing transcriptional regulator